MNKKYDELVMYGFGGDTYLLYRFNQEEGVLQLSMSASDLEILLKERPINEGRIVLDLPLPGPSFPIRVTLNGVRKVESLPNVKEYFFGSKEKVEVFSR